MQRVLNAWRKLRMARAKEGHEYTAQELQEVLMKMRKLGQRGVSLEQFKKSSLVENLRSPMQFHVLGNMIYNNAADNNEEIQKALHVWKIAMNQGSEKAKYSYAVCMKKGIGVLMVIYLYRLVGFPKKDVTGATKLFQELTASGHGWGTFAYANALCNGDGTRKNEKKAFELYRKCAEGGIPPAFMNICNMYTYGKGTKKVNGLMIVA
ncbi:hypothetical protein PsorP6_008332 [Peronosclerospora sorghi]|uniref:Uncharacterized protein n=1 Tax=Peronosclerospora sorghi TaxID=230839 RepID=A0ACC0W6A0_9STRA|nr:hypothetical protein PsorP6_008332 [Peronosclerospora sorghi]